MSNPESITDLIAALLESMNIEPGSEAMSRATPIVIEMLSNGAFDPARDPDADVLWCLEFERRMNAV